MKKFVKPTHTELLSPIKENLFNKECWEDIVLMVSLYTRESETHSDAHTCMHAHVHTHTYKEGRGIQGKNHEEGGWRKDFLDYSFRKYPSLLFQILM